MQPLAPSHPQQSGSLQLPFCSFSPSPPDFWQGYISRAGLLAGLETSSSQRVPAALHVAHMQARQKHSFATQKTTSLHQQQPHSAYKPPRSAQLIPFTACDGRKKPACLLLKISHPTLQGVPVCSWPAQGHPTSPHRRVQRACPQLALCSRVRFLLQRAGRGCKSG